MNELRPSPYVASVRPHELFDSKRHISFGNIFTERTMSPLEAEIESITNGAGMPDRVDQGWMAFAGAKALETVYQLIGADLGSLLPGTGRCGIQGDNAALPVGRIDLYASREEFFLGLCRER
jgi:hypothetical protein